MSQANSTLNGIQWYNEGVWQREVNKSLVNLPLTSPGKKYFVNGAAGNNSNDGLSWETAKLTIAGAISAAVAGDIIFIAPGSYDEQVVITKNNLTIVGVVGRGAVGIAPAAADAKAILIDGTLGARIQGVTLINIGGEGNGTGGGLYIKGDIRRIRTYGCKFEGGAFGAKLESTAQGSVGDLILDDVELAWTTTALHITGSGGGDPVTNVYVRDSLLHNYDTGVLNDATFTSDLWVKKCLFARKESGVVPANHFVNIMAGASGIFADNDFDHDTMAVAKMVIPTAIRWVRNATEAGIGGRPA